MKRRQIIGSLAAASALQAAPSARQRFIGVWRLIRCESRYKDGRIEYPYGEKPVGRITYDKAGRMSAQLMRPGRRATVPSGVGLVAGNATNDEIREAVDGFASYFGTFDVDESTKTVTHHVQGCLVPTWVGTDLKRTYQFTANRLTLTATTTSVRELVWERERD
ncbi:MAG: lipocalin-like domain-containing protein [Acidobacteria bacterium]|nr:lipocalin-like domain-containing protein [Acidobacteriota bacterium]